MRCAPVTTIGAPCRRAGTIPSTILSHTLATPAKPRIADRTSRRLRACPSTPLARRRPHEQDMAGDHPPKTCSPPGLDPPGQPPSRSAGIASCGASATPTAAERRQMIVSASSSMRAIRIASEPPPTSERRCFLPPRRGRPRRLRIQRRVLARLARAAILPLLFDSSRAPPRPPAPPRAGASRRHPHHASAAVGPARLPESAHRSHGTREESGSGRQSAQRTRPDRQKAGGQGSARHAAPRPTPPVSDPASADASGLPARFHPALLGPFPPFLRRRT